MLYFSIQDGIIRKRLLYKRPDTYAHGAGAEVLGVMFSALALLMIGIGTIASLSLLNHPK